MNEPTDPSDLPTGTEHAKATPQERLAQLLAKGAAGALDPQDFDEIDELRRLVAPADPPGINRADGTCVDCGRIALDGIIVGEIDPGSGPVRVRVAHATCPSGYKALDRARDARTA